MDTFVYHILAIRLYHNLSVNLTSHFLYFADFRQQQIPNAGTKCYEILPAHTKTPHYTTHKIANRYFESEYHFSTLQKNPITFEQGCICLFYLFCHLWHSVCVLHMSWCYHVTGASELFRVDWTEGDTCCSSACMWQRVIMCASVHQYLCSSPPPDLIQGLRLDIHARDQLTLLNMSVPVNQGTKFVYHNYLFWSFLSCVYTNECQYSNYLQPLTNGRQNGFKAVTLVFLSVHVATLPHGV